MIKKLTIALGTVVLIALGVTMFAGFESHLIDVRAHVEKATYVTPDDVNFGITIMEEKRDFACTVDPQGVVHGDCMKIHLSDSFKRQTTWQDVTYTIYCEDKPLGNPHRADGNITPFIRLFDSDPGDGDVVDKPDGCGTVAYDTPFSKTANKWAHGELNIGFDEVDWWDMSFYAPLCRNNWNPDTDPIDLTTYPGGGLIDDIFCHKDPGMVNSDEYFDLASFVKFQVTDLSPVTP